MLPLHSLFLSLLIIVPTTAAIRPLTLPNTLSKPIAFRATSTESNSVNPDNFPDWAGDFNLDDCLRAQGLLNGRIAYWDPTIEWTFWSRRWVTKPEGNQWELPFGTRYRERPSLSSSHFTFFLSISSSYCQNAPPLPYHSLFSYQENLLSN